MDFISTTVIASTVYDILKKGVNLTSTVLKEKFSQWIKEELIIETISNEISKLNLHDGLSEKAITERLEQSQEISKIVHEINSKIALSTPSVISTVNQVHSGTGDNVAGKKIVN